MRADGGHVRLRGGGGGGSRGRCARRLAARPAAAARSFSARSAARSSSSSPACSRTRRLRAPLRDLPGRRVLAGVLVVVVRGHGGALLVVVHDVAVDSPVLLRALHARDTMRPSRLKTTHRRRSSPDPSTKTVPGGRHDGVVVWRVLRIKRHARRARERQVLLLRQVGLAAVIVVVVLDVDEALDRLALDDRTPELLGPAVPRGLDVLRAEGRRVRVDSQAGGERLSARRRRRGPRRRAPEREAREAR